MAEQDRAEQELVQEALGNLARPAPPPRLRRAVMAQVRREADAVQAQVWHRAAGKNWAVEWRQGGALPEQEPVPEPVPDLIGPASATFTQWRHQEGNRVTIHQTTRTH